MKRWKTVSPSNCWTIDKSSEMGDPFVMNYALTQLPLPPHAIFPRTYGGGGENVLIVDGRHSIV